MLKTLAGTLVVVAVLLVGLPFFFYQVDYSLEMGDYHQVGSAGRVMGGTLFGAGVFLLLTSQLILAYFGEGIPLFLGGTRRLVIRGPYRHVRNPAAIGLLLAGLGAAIFLGSPLALVYVLAGVAAENFIVRPLEEKSLEARFASAYQQYRRRVWCWRLRWRGYDPGREAEEPPIAAERTNPPGRNVILYDGLCRFCTASVKQLLTLARKGAIEPVSFQDPGALDPFPGISHEACMRQMFLVTKKGKVYGGFEAAVHAVATRPVIGWLTFVYYLPGLRFLLDIIYARIATHRYKILGKMVAAGECPEGTCAVHARDK